MYENFLDVDLTIKISGSGPAILFNHLEVANVVEFLDSSRSNITFKSINFFFKTESKLNSETIRLYQRTFGEMFGNRPFKTLKLTIQSNCPDLVEPILGGVRNFKRENSLNYKRETDDSAVNTDTCLAFDKFTLEELSLVNMCYSETSTSFYDYLVDMIPYLTSLHTLNIENAFVKMRYHEQDFIERTKKFLLDEVSPSFSRSLRNMSFSGSKMI